MLISPPSQPVIRRMYQPPSRWGAAGDYIEEVLVFLYQFPTPKLVGSRALEIGNALNRAGLEAVLLVLVLLAILLVAPGARGTHLLERRQDGLLIRHRGVERLFDRGDLGDRVFQHRHSIVLLVGGPEAL